jgi:Flp pilus assembly protein TadD
VYYRLGRYSDALKRFERVARLRKDGAAADDLFFLAMSYHQLGQRDRARDTYDRAVLWQREQRELPQETGEELRAFHAEASALLGVRDR